MFQSKKIEKEFKINKKENITDKIIEIKMLKKTNIKY